MAAVIDKEIIQMVLDVSGFQDAADDALDVIDQLKDALDFTGIADGLSEIGEQTKNMGFNALQNGLFKVQEGFNALDLFALKVLSRIEDKIIDIGTTLGNAITVEPVKAGLEEYETQINSVQTILANTNDALTEKGFTTEHDKIEKINSVLDELNRYADMTIYNFTEMTRNIGTFTAAGVDLDTAATAIQGIANLAAMSGSNSQQASTVMYQLSQALASGTVHLQDWNSVVNAGMGGKLFQKELIDTASAMHVADDTIAELKEGTLSFRDSLQEDWLSADVLINTLEKFTAGTEGYTKAQVESMQELWRARGYSETQIKELTGSIHQLTEEEEKNLRQKWADKGFSPEQIDHIMQMGTAATDAATKVKTFTQLIDTLKEALQSGWTQSWEYIFGDFEQAKRFWTEISDIMNLYIGKSADSRNAILETWSKAKYSFNEDNQLIDAETGELIEGQKMLASEMGGRELVIQGLRNSFQSLCEIVFQLKEAFRLNFWGHFSSEELEKMEEPLSNIMLTGEKLIDWSRNFESATASFKDSLFTTDRLARLREVFNEFATSCRTLYDIVASIMPSIGNIFDAFFHSSFFKIDVLKTIADAFDYVVNAFKGFGEAFNKHFGTENAANREGLMKFFSAIQGVLETAFWTKLEWITEGFSALGSVFEYLIAPFGTISEILGKLGDKISMLVHAFDDMTHNADGISKISTLFENISKSLNTFIDDAGKSLDFSGILSIFDTIAEVITSDKADLFGTFENVIMSITYAFQGLLSVVTPIATAFVNVFAPALEEVFIWINQVWDRIRILTEHLVANQSLMQGIEALFTGVFNVIKALGELIGTTFLAVWDSLGEILGSFLPTGKELGDIFTDVGDHLTNFSKIIETLVTGEGGVPKLSEIIGVITEKIKGLFEVISDLDPLQKLHDLVDTIFKGLKHALGGTDDMTMLDTIIEKLKQFMDGIKRVFSGDDGELDFDKIFTAGGIAVFIDRVVEMFKRLKDSTSDISGIIGIVKTFVEGLGEVFEAFKERLKVETIKTVATSLLEIAAALFIIAMIDPVALAQAVGTIELMFEAIKRVITQVANLNGQNAGDLASSAALVLALGQAILLLAIGLKIISSIDTDDLIQGLIAVTILLNELTAVAKRFSEFETSGSFGDAAALIGLAIALDLLIIPVKMFGEMDLGQLAQGMVATGIALAGLVIAAQQLGKAKDFGMTDAIALILMAESIKVLAKACEIVSNISWEGLAKGLSVFAVALVGMIGASTIISKADLGAELLELGGSLMMLGAAMLLLDGALHGISNLSWEDLGKGLSVFAVALIGLGIASYAINGQNLLMIGGAIFLIATAFTELSIAINLAQLLAPICMALAGAFNAIKDSMVEFANHAAFESFLGMLERLITFLPRVVTALAQALIDFVVTLGNGAAQIVGAVVNLGSAILQGIIQLTPQLFEALGTFFTELWAFLIEQIPQLFEVLGTFFTELWTFLTEQIPQAFEVLGTFFTELFAFLTEQTPNFFEFLGTLIGEVINFINNNTGQLIELIRSVLDTLLQAIIQEAPVIGQAVTTIITTVLQVIQTTVPEITKTLLSLLNDILAQLAEYVPQMAESALKIIGGFLQAVADNIDDIVKSGIDIALAFIKGITEKMDDIVDAAFKLIIGFIEGLAKAIDENHDDLFEAVGHLITAIFNAIVDGVKKMAEGAQKLIGGFLDEFDGEQLMKDLATIGGNLVTGLINGIVGLAGNLWDECGRLAQGALTRLTNTFDSHSPSRKGMEIGGYLAEGLALGIHDNASMVADNAGDMALGAIDAMSILNDDIEYTPTVTPVIDTESLDGNMIVPNSEFQEMVHDEVSISSNDLVNNQKDLQQDLISQLSQMSQNEIQMVQQGVSALQLAVQQATEAVRSMKVIMDSGALVGQISSDMDSSLGDAAALSRRGVI